MSQASALSAASVVVRNPGTMTDEVDGEVLAMNVDNGAFYGLNAVGSHVWNLIAEPRAVGDICDQLTAAYDVERSVCELEVLGLLETLREEHLIQVAGEAPAPKTLPAEPDRP